METTGAIGDYDRTGVVTIYANSMTFTYFPWLIAEALKIPASKLTAAGRRRRQLRLEVLHAQGADARGLPLDAGRGSR